MIHQNGNEAKRNQPILLLSNIGRAMVLFGSGGGGGNTVVLPHFCPSLLTGDTRYDILVADTRYRPDLCIAIHESSIA